MTRRCSHCSNYGHNSRTCPGVKLFGVRLTDGKIIKKSASMGNLSSLHLGSSSSAAVSPNHSSPNLHHDSDGQGYLSDDPSHSVNRRADRKKGTPWTEEEHRQFLIGLQKLGKGDWRGIARNYVITRSPTQVASHAQKYFIRQTNATRRKRRSSLFDMVPDVDMDTPAVPEEQFLPPPQARESDNGNSASSLSLSLNQEQSMEASSNETVPEAEETMIQIESDNILPLPPTFYPAYLSVPFQFWSPNLAPTEEEKPETSYHQVIKPIPIIPKKPVNVDELVGMSQLRIGETENGHKEPSPLSLKLLGTASRQSAFHAKTTTSGSELSDGKTNEIQAA